MAAEAAPSRAATAASTARASRSVKSTWVRLARAPPPASRNPRARSVCRGVRTRARKRKRTVAFLRIAADRLLATKPAKAWQSANSRTL